MTIISRCTQIRNILKKAKSPIVFFDSDCDGATSYFQLKKNFPKCKGYPIGKDLEKQKYLTQYVSHENDVVLFIDVPVISNNLLEQLTSKELVWVDHHPNDNDEKVERYNINYLNPTTQFDLNLPGTYLAYKICGDKSNISKCVLGSIADFFLQDVIIELESLDKRMFNVLFKNLKDDKKKEIFDFINKNSKRGTTANSETRDKYIRYLTYETNVNVLRNFIESILKLKEDEDTIKAIREVEKLELDEILQNINSEKGQIYEDFAKTKKIYNDVLKKALKQKHTDNLFFFSYEGERGFAGALSQEINYKISSKVIAIAFHKEDKDYYTCSLRGRDVDVLEILNYAMRGLRANGGGHKFATGSAIHKDDFEVFKKRIFEKCERAENRKLELKNRE